MKEYKRIIEELIEQNEQLKWFDSGSTTCFSTIYNGNGIIICYYFNDEKKEEKASFHFLDDRGYYIEDKGFECGKENECFEQIKKLHGFAKAKIEGLLVS